MRSVWVAFFYLYPCELHQFLNVVLVRVLFHSFAVLIPDIFSWKNLDHVGGSILIAPNDDGVALQELNHSVDSLEGSTIFVLDLQVINDLFTDAVSLAMLIERALHCVMQGFVRDRLQLLVVFHKDRS
jgi:citrate lyase gamma subunit